MWPAQIIAEIVMNCCGPFERLNPIVWTLLGRSLYFRNLLGCFPVSLFLQSRHFFRFTVRTALKPGNILHVEVQYRLDTYPEGMIEREAIVPFFKWTQLFDFAVSLFLLLSKLGQFPPMFAYESPSSTASLPSKLWSRLQVLKQKMLKRQMLIAFG